MPCRSDDDDCSDAYRSADRATKAACDIVRVVRDRGVWRDVVNGLSKSTQKWIEQHDKADADRLEREAEEAKAKALKKRALGKLTNKERAALGL